MTNTISKSLYIKGVQCTKALWLNKYKKELLTPPDDTQKAIFETGEKVGKVAMQLFPNGKEIVFEDTSFTEKIALTQRYIDEGVETIYEATFMYHNVLVMVDILHHDKSGWNIYEVKSSSHLKDVYLDDASIQYFVLKGCGLDIASVNVVHINNKYVRGKTLEIEKLFTLNDVTQEILSDQDEIPSQLEQFDQALEKECEPDIGIGVYCLEPYECNAKAYCWKHIPEYSIFDIGGLRKKKKFKLYKEGFIHFEDIPKDMSFSDAQKMQIQSVFDDKTIINDKAIKRFLDQLTYPIYHLDFESYQQAIPEFEGVKPFQQIPFQYSLHIEYEDGKVEHKEFLAEVGSDPREALAQKLIIDIPENVTVLAYNMHFEKGVIKNLAYLFPGIASKLMAIHHNIKDLMTPFKNRYLYTPMMKGSYSIKVILPALIPEMEDAYKNLDGVQNGGEAMNAFSNLTTEDSQEKVQSVRKSLLAYCKLDTLAMVKILSKLKEVVN